MYEYKARLLRVVDGDTVDAMVDLGFNVWIKQRIRLYGVDTWECRTRDKEEKKKGLAAKAFTKEMLGEPKLGRFKIVSHGVGKYGRVLGEIYVEGQLNSLNDLLKANGHAYSYYGGKKRVFKDKK